MGAGVWPHLKEALMFQDRLNFTPARALECAITTVASIVIAIAVVIVVGVFKANAQHNHDEGHHDYTEWMSGRTWNCCNEKDCGDLNEDEVRETPTGTEVLVKTEDNEPKWCPVTKQHFLIKGRSPDWSKPHACIINANTSHYSNPCDAFLCFVPKGGV
jgi:hypothetical protein